MTAFAIVGALALILSGAYLAVGPGGVMIVIGLIVLCWIALCVAASLETSP